MTAGELGRIIIASTKDYIAKQFSARDKRLDDLEHRTTRLSEHCARLETRLAKLEREAGVK